MEENNQFKTRDSDTKHSSKAVVMKSYGSYDCLSVEPFPLPPLQDKIQVEVYVCGLNFADLYTRQGLMQCSLPAVLGMECAGIVTDISGAPESNFKVGQRVVCYNYTGGMHQDIIRIEPFKCYPVPDDVTFEQVVAIFVNYLTAYFAIMDMGNLKPGETVFIQSCGGGVGCAATQLARLIPDVTIVGTTSACKNKTVKANGVDHVMSYEILDNQLHHFFPKGLDLIIDNQGGSSFTRLQGYLKPLGRIILTGANSIIKNDKKISFLTLLKLWWESKNIVPTSLIVYNRTVCGLHLGTLADARPDRILTTLNILFDLLREEKIKPIIDSLWPIEDVVEATKRLGERKNVGKVLLTVRKEQ